jgi:hypothetical protein
VTCLAGRCVFLAPFPARTETPSTPAVEFPLVNTVTHRGDQAQRSYRAEYHEQVNHHAAPLSIDAVSSMNKAYLALPFLL